MQVGGDQPTADGMDHVLMQRLQVDQLSALVLEFHAGLSQLGCQTAGQVGDRHVSEEVGQDHRLQRLQISVWRDLVGRDFFKIRKFQQRAKQDEGNRSRQISPVPGQQDAGHDDQQGVEEIEERINSSGHVNYRCGKGQVGKNLGDGLQLVLIPEGEQHDKKNGNRVPDQDYIDEQA